MDITPFTALALLTATIIGVQDLIRYALAGKWKQSGGIVLAYLGGWGAVTLAAHASVTQGYKFVSDGPVLGNLDGASLLMLGIAVGSLAPLVVNFKKAFDNSDSAQVPKLGGD